MSIRSLLQTAAVVIGTLVIIKIFNLSIPLNIDSTTSARSGEFSVSGTGKVDIVPDTANVTAGISVSNVRTSQEAENRMSQINNKIIDALKGLGIQKEDIKTSNFSINPEYDYGREFIAPDQNRIIGYSGNATVTIKVKKTSDTSPVIDEVTKAGANNVQLGGFTVENPEKFQRQARDEAIKDAKDQANKLAKSLGIRLGRVVNLVESGGYPQPYYREAYGTSADMKMQEVPAPQIEPGSQTVTSTVTLFYQTK